MVFAEQEDSRISRQRLPVHRLSLLHRVAEKPGRFRKIRQQIVNRGGTRSFVVVQVVCEAQRFGRLHDRLGVAVRTVQLCPPGFGRWVGRLLVLGRGRCRRYDLAVGAGQRIVLVVMEDAGVGSCSASRARIPGVAIEYRVGIDVVVEMRWCVRRWRGAASGLRTRLGNVVVAALFRLLWPLGERGRRQTGGNQCSSAGCENQPGECVGIIRDRITRVAQLSKSEPGDRIPDPARHIRIQRLIALQHALDRDAVGSGRLRHIFEPYAPEDAMAWQFPLKFVLQDVGQSANRCLADSLGCLRRQPHLGRGLGRRESIQITQCHVGRESLRKAADGVLQRPARHSDLGRVVGREGRGQQRTDRLPHSAGDIRVDDPPAEHVLDIRGTHACSLRHIRHRYRRLVRAGRLGAVPKPEAIGRAEYSANRVGVRPGSAEQYPVSRRCIDVGSLGHLGQGGVFRRLCEPRPSSLVLHHVCAGKTDALVRLLFENKSGGRVRCGTRS
ncbi:hypothetical protein [Nocardia beijingensis]